MGWRGQANRDADGASAEATAGLWWLAATLLVAGALIGAIAIARL